MKKLVPNIMDEEVQDVSYIIKYRYNFIANYSYN